MELRFRAGEQVALAGYRLRFHNRRSKRKEGGRDRRRKVGKREGRKAGNMEMEI